jgi:hypothetical protein
MEDKAAQAAQKVMHVELKRNKYTVANHDKSLKEQMAEQSRKHAAELEALHKTSLHKRSRHATGARLQSNRTL